VRFKRMSEVPLAGKAVRASRLMLAHLDGLVALQASRPVVKPVDLAEAFRAP